MEESENIRRLIEAIHRNEGSCVIHTVGCGCDALFWLQSAPQSQQCSSRTLLEATVPCCRAALSETISDNRPRPSVSRAVAARLAGCALLRAAHLLRSSDPFPSRGAVGSMTNVFGVSCTASICPSKCDGRIPVRSEAWIVVWDTHGIDVTRVLMVRGKRSRKAEEDVVSKALINSIARAKGVHSASLLFVGLPSLSGDPHSEGIRHERISFAAYLSAVASSTPNKWPSDPNPFFVITADGEALTATEWHATARGNGPVVFTGSFNPLHNGHRSLLSVVSRLKNTVPIAELSLTNADKPSLSQEDALSRAAQFAGNWPVALSSGVPLFVQKARVYGRGTVFVVGFDTASRVLDAKYYGGKSESAEAVLRELKSLGCSFLVAGRVDAKSGVYHSFEKDHDRLPFPEFHGLFCDIPESVFRVDLSSTQLRNGRS